MRGFPILFNDGGIGSAVKKLFRETPRRVFCRKETSMTNPNKHYLILSSITVILLS